MDKPQSPGSFDKLFDAIEKTRPAESTTMDNDALPENTQRLTWEDRLKEEELHDLRQNRFQRKEYAESIYRFLLTYMFLIFVLLAACGFEKLPFTLSDTVLVAIITTTTANVIGIFVFVVKYLFNPK